MCSRLNTRSSPVTWVGIRVHNHAVGILIVLVEWHGTHGEMQGRISEGSTESRCGYITKIFFLKGLEALGQNVKLHGRKYNLLYLCFIYV